jgi:hypothetical protein
MYNKMLHTFGKFIINQLIAEHSKNRMAQFINLESAKSIIFVYDESIKDDADVLTKFISYLMDWKKEVYLLTYSDLAESSIKAQCEHIHLHLKLLNWNGIPNENQLKNLLNKNFDLLIDLNFQNQIALSYLVLKSKALMTVSNDRSITVPFHDLYILTKQEEGLKAFFREMDKYLGSILMRKAS